MLILPVLPDTKRWLSLADKSRGKVMLHLPDRSRCDLKQDRTPKQARPGFSQAHYFDRRRNSGGGMP